MKCAEGVVRVDVAGAGYLNLYLDRVGFVLRSLDEPQALTPQLGSKIIVEHAWFWKLAQALFEVLPRNEED